jgi:sugar/nucleoside kinase (ribokinase family)
VPRIAVAGHVCVDLAPALATSVGIEPGLLREVGALAMSVGGTVANTGLDLAALGADVALFATVGDDDLGRLVATRLGESLGVRVDLEVSRTAATSYSLVFQPPDADRGFLHHVGANAEFDGSSVDLDGIELLHVGYPSLLPALVSRGAAPLHELLVAARVLGVTTSLDLAVVDPASGSGYDWGQILRSVAADTDVLSPSIDDLTSALGVDEPFSLDLVDRLARQFIDWGVAVVAISAGVHGQVIRTSTAARFREAGGALASRAESWADRSLRVPPLWSGDLVSTNGAGDASSAGLIYGITAGASLEQSCDLAAASAAAVIAGRTLSPSTVVALSPGLARLFAKPDVNAEQK